MKLFDRKVISPVRTWDAHLAINKGSQSAQRQEVLKWAYGNAEVHAILSVDLLLYEVAVSIFRQQIGTL